ncbi:MAG: family 20 glycosylhydrolase [Clostridia bacterium]|nr:family 20 glycosylhydrolase [Clostridia bacterium]
MRIESIPQVKNAVYGKGTEFSLPLNISLDNYKEKAKALIDALYCDYAVTGTEGNIKASFDKNLKIKGEYGLKISSGKAHITYGDYEGLRNALAHISNILKIREGKAYLPECDFSDKPRFTHRGVMIDLARGIPGKERFLYDLILMAKAKINILHLHLSDNKGFAIKLSVLKEEMFIENAYSISEMKELISLCDSLGLEIIPEFDCPGHSGKLVECYPYLTCETGLSEQSKWTPCIGEGSVFKIYENIIDELCEIFPYEYFHIGGDELSFDDLGLAAKCHWAECKKCNAFMKDNGIADVQDLYYYVMTKAYEMVKKNGKKVIMWNDQIDTEREIKLPSDIILHFWRVAAPMRGPHINVSMNSQLKTGRKMINSHFPEAYVDIDYAHERANKEDTVGNWKIDERPYSDEELKENIIGSEMCAWEYGNEKDYPHYSYTLPSEFLIYGDKMWNNECFSIDEDYEKALTKILLGFTSPDDLNVFTCLGGAILSRKNEKCITSKITKDKAFLIETKNALSERHSRLARIYSECIEEALEKI